MMTLQQAAQLAVGTLVGGDGQARLTRVVTDSRAVQPWDKPGFKTPGFPGGQVWSPPGVQTFIGGNAMIAGKTNGVYPAPKAIMSCVYEGLQLPFDSGLKVETRYFVSLLRDPVAKSMIRTLFFGLQEANKLARRPKGVAKQEYKKIGVLGAGLMGAGIATVSVQAGLDIVLIDRDQAAADKGKAHIAGELDKLVKRGRLTQDKRDQALGRVTATPDFGALKDVQLVIEAVFENREVKAEATKKAEAVLPKESIFASNTSTLPITSLAETAKDPAKFIGIHFFSPVERMLLVEIIVGKQTGDKALATALDFVRALRKTPIVVNDTRGFYANRCVLNYIQEGHLMLLEGIPAAMIENTARMAGMPVGPLSLNDETALDLGLKIVRAAEADLGPQAVDPGQKKLLEDMVEKHQRLGRKNGKGFYDYASKPKRLWPGIADLQPKKLSGAEIDRIDVEEMKQRFLAVMAVEAARTFEEGVVTDVREADVGSILGWGFAPYSGGTLSYIDMMGTKKFVALCEKLEKKYGARFKPTPLLIDMAKTDDRFYRRFAPKTTVPPWWKAWPAAPST